MDIDVNPGTSKGQLDTLTKTDFGQEMSASFKVDIKYFECSNCILRVPFEYFGNTPPWYKQYCLLEEAYVIEDPYLPSKQGKIIILGAHCIKCSNLVCKDTTCSIYFEGTYCIKCAKAQFNTFPATIQSKLNKIVR